MNVKQRRVCRLCGKPFYSNKRFYCEPEHARIWNTMLKRNKSFTALLVLLAERREMGAMIEGFWAKALSEYGWLKQDKDGFSELTKWGWERVEIILKEQRNGQRKERTTNIR